MRTGDMIGAYRIDTVGSTACAATHQITGASVRLRWVAPAGDPATFVQAVRRLCGVQSPALHGLIDVGIEAGRVYLVDAPLTGEALEAHVARLGPLTGKAGLAFVESLFAALVELHGRDLRDGALTPARLRVVDGQARLVDPGLGRLLPALTPDPQFAAPGAGGAATVADDLYAAGAIACFALNGRHLPPAAAIAATGTSAPIQSLLRSCLDPTPAARPDDAETPRRTIEAVLAGTLSATPVADDTAPADGWFTDGTVEATAGEAFDYSHVPDELPESQAAVGIGAAPTPAPAAPTPSPAAPRPAPTPTRAAPRPPARPAPKRNALPIALLLVVIAAGVAAFFYLRPQSEADLPPGVATAPEPSAPPTQATPSAAPPPASTASAASAAPPSRDPDSVVTVEVQPAPARFVQVDSKTVLCESAEVCEVPIDVDTRIEKDGFTPTVLSGDDLYDRRGHRWKVRLYPPKADKR